MTPTLAPLDTHAAPTTPQKSTLPELIPFDDEALRNTLIRSAGRELSFVAESANSSLKEQTEAMISQTTVEFDDVIRRMTHVRESVSDIESTVDSMVQNSRAASDQLTNVGMRMRSFEAQFHTIQHLVGTINQVSEQARVLALNASIEAARVGEYGKGFSVVAREVKELADATKKANEEVGSSLKQIGVAVRELSDSVTQSVTVVEDSIQTVNSARVKTQAIDSETAHFCRQLQSSLDHFRSFAVSTSTVDNDLKEVKTIGETFYYLLELMARQGMFRDGVDPLERLAPLVAASDFYQEARFRGGEAEYELTERDILISATNPKGIITFANNRFYEIAEYEAGELVGRSHSVIRHPDIPKAAFADLWSVIQSGRMWQGYIKNRSKSGRGYWVKASVFPCYEAGRVVGYISIRTKPERSKVQAAIDAYRCLP